MSDWKTKRFWTAASVAPRETGFTVELDGRQVKTPAKSLLVLPNHTMALAVAEEWEAQEDKIDPATMPVTRAANAAIDKVTVQHEEVATLIAAYGDSDLLCYRAEGPQELIERQAQAWDPLLDWAAGTLGARLRPVSGVMHAAQNPDALQTLSEQVHAMDPFALTAMHDLVGLTGSLIIGFAAVHNVDDIGALWRLSRVDETWQEELWGVDEEARAQAAVKESDFYAAKRFHDLALAQS